MTPRSCALGIALLSAASTVSAAAVDEALLKGMKYRLVGPYRGGRASPPSASPASRTRITSARWAAASGRPRTAAMSWTPLFDEQSIALDRRASPSPTPTRTSSTSGRARPASAATSRTATASTSRPTRARPGRTSACATRARSARILVHPDATPTSSTSRRSATVTARTRSAASSARATAARRGRRSSSSDDKTGRDRPRDGPDEPARPLRGDLGRPTHALDSTSGGPGSGLYQVDRRRRHLDEAQRRACPRACSARSASPSRRRDSEPRLGPDRSARTGGRLPLRRRRARPGRSSNDGPAASASAPGTTCTSSPTRTTPRPSTS